MAPNYLEDVIETRPGARIYNKTNEDVLVWREVLDHHIASVVRSSVTGDEAIKETMRRCYEETGYLLCPHTATAVNYCFKQRDSKSIEVAPSLQVCIATASPAKFPETVTAAGLTPQTHPIIDSLSTKPTRFTDVKHGENFEQILREKIIAISESKTSVL